MARFIAAVLLIALVGASRSSDPLATARSRFAAHLPQRGVKSTRQTTCDPISQTCVDEATEITDDLAGVTTVDDFNSLLDSYCGSSCFSETVAYYDCIGVPDTELFCAQNANGDYCFTLLFSVSADALTCGFTETCDIPGLGTDCQSTLQTASDDLGCCATIVLAQSQFDVCNVTTAAQCSGAGIDSHVGFGLLTIFVMAAAFFNRLLF